MRITVHWNRCKKETDVKKNKIDQNCHRPGTHDSQSMNEKGRQRDNTRRIQASIRQAVDKLGLVFMDDRIVVLVDLRRTLLDVLHFGHAATTKTTAEAKIFWWSYLFR